MIDIIERPNLPDPKLPDLSDPEPIVYTVNYSTIYHPFDLDLFNPD